MDLLEEYEEGRIAKYLGKDSAAYKNIDDLLMFLPSWVKRKHESEENLNNVRPSTCKILEIDREFRDKNNYNSHDICTTKIKFNGGLLKVFYSDSEKAKRFHSDGDWVNIHFEYNESYLKWVVLTSKYGNLKGKRIVLGEERASKEFYNGK